MTSPANGPLIRADMREGEVSISVPSRTRKKSRRKCLILSALALLIFLIFLFIIFLLAWKLITAGNDAPCLNKSCIQTAATLLNSIDETVDPCDDFYMYACGQWIKNNPLPDDQGHISNFMNLNIQLEEKLKGLLNQPITEDEPEPSLAVHKVKNFYNICMHDDLVMRTWNTSFQTMQQEIVQWPALAANFTTTKSLELIYAQFMSKYRIDSLFKISVQPDDKNSSAFIIFFDLPIPSFRSREWWQKTSLNSDPERAADRQAYENLVYQVLLLLGVGLDAAQEAAEDVLFFEDTMSNLTNIDDGMRDIDKVYEKVNIDFMATNYPNFDWHNFFQILYRNVVDKQGNRVRIDGSTTIVMHGRQFLDQFNIKVPEFKNELFHKTLNYMMWSWFYKNMLSELRDPFAMRYFEFSKQVSGAKLPSLPWHTCVRKANHYFPFATTRIYVKRYFDNEAKHKVQDMIKGITKAFSDLLEIEDWLTEGTKKVANEKIDAIQSKIGYPDFIHNPDVVDALYEDLSVVENDYFATKFSFDKVGINEMLANIYEPVNRTKWTSGGAVVNAFYSPNTNEIIFPAGILQPVFYSPEYPWSMNFGGIGVVIGHEITHGFDDKGRLYDKFGNMRLWWDNVTVNKFKEKSLCIEEQYANYTVPGLDNSWRVNGKRTKGENIADNGGLKQAYRAYKGWESENGKESSLPGLKLTHDQLFFINYAQIWCGTSTVQEEQKKILTSEHSPPSIRVRGPISNSHDFAAAFSCPIGSPMNPSKSEKCSVW